MLSLAWLHATAYVLLLLVSLIAPYYMLLVMFFIFSLLFFFYLFSINYVPTFVHLYISNTRVDIFL
jgi:hypothetical protein